MTTTFNATVAFGYQEWNRRLLRQYFGADPNGADWRRPVTHLYLTSEGLHSAAGSPPASPTEVKTSFLSMFAREHRERTFSRVAADNGEWTPAAYADPPFVVHLLVSCLVATDFETEETYRGKLDEACGNGKQNSTEALPALWEQLQEWLDNVRRRGDAFRTLVLPARRERGWTNIGLSIDLAFPRRHDREELLQILSGKNLLRREPTIGAILSALQGRGKRFSTQFNAVLADFTHTVERGEARWNHAFWLSVRDACLAGPETTGVELLLLMNPDPTGFRPFLVARSEEDPTRLGYGAMPFPLIDDWPAAVHAGGDYEQPVKDLLAGKIELPGISECVHEGILGFAPLQEDLVGWISRTRLSHATHALVRRDSLQRFNALSDPNSGTPLMRTRDSRFDPWLEIEGFKMAPTYSAPVIKESLIPPMLEVDAGSGIAMGDGWLGEEGLLPLIVTSERVRNVGFRSLPGNGDSVSPTALLSVEDGPNGTRWRFPPSRRDGAFVVEAEFSDGTTSATQLRLYRAPIHTAFAVPTPAHVERSFVEGGRSDILPFERSVPVIVPHSDDGHDHISFGSDSTYLGSVVGDWSPTKRDGFDWLLSRNVHPRLRFVGDPGYPTPPADTAVQCKSAARAWRRCFGRDDIAGPTAVIGAYRAAAKRTHLPTSLAGVPFPETLVDEPPSVEQHPGVDRFTFALAASAVRRSALSEAEIFRLLGLAFDLNEDWSLRYAILRAWVEAGILEEAADARWSSRRYVARRPRLVLYRVGGAVLAAVVGLVVPAVRSQLERLALAAGGSLVPHGSISAWAPGALLLDGVSVEAMHAIERNAELATSEWLPTVTSLIEPVWKVLPPTPYEDLPRQLRIQTWDWERGIFQEGESLQQIVSLYRCSARNQPTRFEIRSGDRRSWSTSSRTWALLVAHHLRGECPFENNGLIVRPKLSSGAHLPMPLARAIAILSRATGGPITIAGRLRYQYWFPSIRAVRLVLNDIFCGTPG